MPGRMPRAAGEAKPRRSRLLVVGLPVFSVFAAFAIIVWIAYQEDPRVPIGEPPLIKAIAGPYKVAPDDPGGRQFADQGEINRLLRDEPESAGPERVLPLPEEPRRPVVTETLEQPMTQEPVAPAEEIQAADEDALREAETALARLLADVGPAAAPDQLSPTTEQATGTTSGTTVPVPAMRPSEPAAPVEGPSSEADEALNQLLAELAVDPTATSGRAGSAGAPPATVAAIAPTDRTAGQGPIEGSYRVQLAAVREQDDLSQAWGKLVEHLGGLVAEYEPHYERAETANGVFYRIQLGPFASEQSAERMCAEIQRQNASCFVVIP